MILEEALTVGLISIEDLQKMRDGFSMSGLDRYIVGKTVTSKSDGPGTVISVHTDLPAINIDFGGTVHAISYPEGFLKAVRFDDKKFQDYIDARGLYKRKLKWRRRSVVLNSQIIRYTFKFYPHTIKF